MKLFCCFTPAHEILFLEIFLTSVSKDFNLVPLRLEIEGQGDFLSPEFLQCIGRKMDLVLTSIRENWGELIVWSDVDIQFFDLPSSSLRAELGEKDLVFQREAGWLPDVNTGFLLCRCNVFTDLSEVCPLALVETDGNDSKKPLIKEYKRFIQRCC